MRLVGTTLDQLPYAKPWFAAYQTVAVRKTLEDELQLLMLLSPNLLQLIVGGAERGERRLKPPHLTSPPPRGGEEYDA